MNFLQSQLIAGPAVGCRKEKWVTATKSTPAAAHGWFSGRRGPRDFSGRAGETVAGGVGCEGLAPGELPRRAGVVVGKAG